MIIEKSRNPFSIQVSSLYKDKIKNQIPLSIVVIPSQFRSVLSRTRARNKSKLTCRNPFSIQVSSLGL